MVGRLLRMAAVGAVIQFVWVTSVEAQDPPAPANVVAVPGGGTGQENLLDSNNNVLEGGKKLDVSWDEVTVGTPTGYRVQWRNATAADWSAALSHDVDGASTTSYTIDQLTNGETYLVRVYTLFGADQASAPSAEVSATAKSAVQQMIDFIETEVIAKGEELDSDGRKKAPWLKESWDRVPRDLVKIDRSNDAGSVQITCNDNNHIWAPYCEIASYNINVDFVRDKETIIHELYHALTTGHRRDHPISPLDAMHLAYMSTTSSDCGVIVFEIPADTATIVTFNKLYAPEELTSSVYWTLCQSRNWPTQEELDVTSSFMLERKFPSWFITRFGDGSESRDHTTWDDDDWSYDEQAAIWAYYLASPIATGATGQRHLQSAHQGMEQLFPGGFCYTQLITSIPFLESSIEDYDRIRAELDSVINPWAAKGCYPTEPTNLSAVYSSEVSSDGTVPLGKVTVTFGMPVSEGPPRTQGFAPVNRFKVTLTKTTGPCRTSRQVEVTDLDNLSAEFSGLGAGQYVVEVQALNLLAGPHDAQASTTVNVPTGGEHCEDVVLVPPDWPLIPDGIGAGEQFRLLFSSSRSWQLGGDHFLFGQTDGIGDDIADYETILQDLIKSRGHADAKPHASWFSVLGSSYDEDVRDRTNTFWTPQASGVPIYWLNGAKAANDYVDFYDGTWEYTQGSWGSRQMGNNESGRMTRVDQIRFLTGSNHDGTARREHISFLPHVIRDLSIGARYPDDWQNLIQRGTPHVGFGGRNYASDSGPLWSGGQRNNIGYINNQRDSFYFYGLSGVFEVAEPVVFVEAVNAEAVDDSASSKPNHKFGQLRVSLPRGLCAGERVSVPLLFDGVFHDRVPTPSGNFRVILEVSGLDMPAGVTWNGERVTFTGLGACVPESVPGSGWCGAISGESASEALFSFLHVDDDTDDEMMTVSIPSMSQGSGIVVETHGVCSLTAATMGSGQITVTDNDVVQIRPQPQPSQPLLPTPSLTSEISIVAGGNITEGGTSTFTLSANPVPATDLQVIVNVTADGDYGVSTGFRTVTIATTGTGSLTVATVDDSSNEPDGSVTVTLVAANSSYTLDTAATSATVTVADNDAQTQTSQPSQTQSGTPVTQRPPTSPAPQRPTDDELAPATQWLDLDTAYDVHRDDLTTLATDGLFNGLGCDEQLLCPTQPITRWQFAVLLIRLLENTDTPTLSADAGSFSDVESEVWWSKHVQRLDELGVTRGCSIEPDLFCPNQLLNRAQAAQFITAAFNLPAADSAGFTDVTSNHVHAAAIDALFAAGVTNGCGSDPLRFCPQQSLTRQQAASLLNRASSRSAASAG